MVNKKIYNENGFLLLKNFFRKDEILNIHEDARSVFRTQLIEQHLDTEDLTIEANFDKALYTLFEQDVQEVMNCGKQIQHLISLHRLGTDPRIIDALAALGLGRPCISARPVMFFNSRKLAKA